MRGGRSDWSPRCRFVPVRRIRYQMPYGKPMANPSNPNIARVPKCRSSQIPKKPGPTIATETVVIVDTQVRATTIGGRRSGGRVLTCERLVETDKRK